MIRYFLDDRRRAQRALRTPMARVAGPRAEAAGLAAGAEASGEASGETVATYLNQRLAQIGVTHVFAIPGDYVAEWVETLDVPETSAGLVRVHPNNEMNAAYAADGYARSRAGAVGCMAFTYGVGALNAAQAVAGSMVEQVPVVLVNGAPSAAQYNSERDQGVLYHHMLDGARTDLRVFAELTEMAVRLDNPTSAPDLIDAALRACITASRPVYIELPTSTALLPCRALPDEPLVPAPPPQSARSLGEAVDAIVGHMKAAKRLVLMGGVEVGRYGLHDRFERLVELADAPFVTSALGKSVVDEGNSRFAGVYMGQSAPPATQQLMREADCVVSLGVLDTDFNYLGVVTPDYVPGGNRGLPGPNHIQARRGAVMVGRQLAYWGDVQLGALIEALIAALEGMKGLPGAPFPGLEGSASPIPPPSTFGADDAITYDSFKSHLVHGYLAGFEAADHPVLVADSGFSFVNLIDVPVPRGCYVAQLAWAAIGFGVGATPGVTLAHAAAGAPRRAVTVTGDGAFAETLSVLGTIAQLEQDAVVFVMDNRVFAVEQWLVDPNAFCPEAPPPEFVPLTAIPQGHIWDYVKLAEGFGGRGYAVSSNAELAAVMKQIAEVPRNPVTGGPTFTLVAVRLPEKDLPGNTRWKLTCASESGA